MSKLEVGDLFIVIGCCPECRNGEGHVGRVETVLHLAHTTDRCSNCRRAFESLLVYGSNNLCWPEFAVRKIEPLSKEDEVLLEKKISC